MKLKLDEKGQVVLENGLPVWVADDGKEIAYDVPRLVNDLSKVNGESAGRRKEIDALNEKLKAFENIDPTKYRELEEKLASIDQGKLIEAGKVEELKASVAKGYGQRLAEHEHHERSDHADGQEDLHGDGVDLADLRVILQRLRL